MGGANGSGVDDGVASVTVIRMRFFCFYISVIRIVLIVLVMKIW